MNRIKVSIEGIEPKQGSVIVAKCTEDDIHITEARELYNILQQTFPDNRVVIIPSNFRITELDEKKFWDFIEGLKKLRPLRERESKLQ